MFRRGCYRKGRVRYIHNLKFFAGVRAVWLFRLKFQFHCKIYKIFLAMATYAVLSTALSSLSISTRFIRPVPSLVYHFSTTPIPRGSETTHLRRERQIWKRKRSEARAEELRRQREARADPIVGRSTPFTRS